MKKSLLYLSGFLLVTLNLKAQTTNTGMLVVSENTQFSTVDSFDNHSGAEFYNDGDAYIYNHFNNEGVVDYYQQKGLTRLVGDNIQEIKGSQTSYLYNVLFYNTSATVPFQLYGKLDISGTADFYEGILDNDNFGGTVNFAPTGVHINASDFSHVDGKVFKTGTSAFTYPIGDKGYYRFAGTSETSALSNIYSAKFYFEDTNAKYPHKLRAGVIEEIDNQEHWVITKESAQDDEALITLSWRDVTTPQTMIDAAEEGALTIVRWDEATNMWVNEGGAIDVDNQTVTTAVSGYGIFTFGRLDSGLVLPCGLAIYNSLTPNGDGINDFFFIDAGNTDCVRNIHITIFNRWGVQVYQSDNYGKNGNVFDGFSNGRLTISDSDRLPSGTYYYIMNLLSGSASNPSTYKKAGYLYISGN